VVGSRLGSGSGKGGRGCGVEGEMRMGADLRDEGRRRWWMIGREGGFRRKLM
jgi:hypothetical protein